MDRRDRVLIRLIAFSMFYGLVFINWVDLFNVAVPAYHLWVLMGYFIPFGVLLAVRGFEDWELALSLGLLASLGNDLGYFVVGDLFFGFHVPLFDWYLHQLGFYGWTVLFTFQGGFFSFPVYSWMMGLAVYARLVVVVLSLRRWWGVVEPVDPSVHGDP
jgi:hypothetical protein